MMGGPEVTVDEAIRRLLADHNPETTDPIAFREARFDLGLAWVHFPPGLGGLGLRPSLNRYVETELRARGAQPPDPAAFFLNLFGPTLAAHGTEEQQQRFLRPMYSGRERWCQLFSEPGAGSDLAAVATRAVADGDSWIVNGQKVWNTGARLADYGMLLARTDPDASKHHGITYLIVDMKSPGVRVRPLRQITGDAEFNEVYLSEVRVADHYRVGPLNGGWRVAQTTLTNERVSLAGGEGRPARRATAALPALELWSTLDDSEKTPVRRDHLMQLWCAAEVKRLTSARAGALRRAGNPGPEGSVAKLAVASLNQAAREFCLTLLGADGQVGYDYTFRLSDDINLTGDNRGPRHAFLRTRANSIEGGTSEIMRNMVAEQVLGLPPEPRPDRSLAWSALPRN